MIKTVIFDLGGVLFTDGSAIAVDKISEEYGVPVSELHEVISGEIGFEYREGKLERDQFWMAALKEWGLMEEDNWEEMADEMELLWCESYEQNEGVVEIIESLKEKGFEVLYLSDNVAERVEYLDQKYDFLDLFDGGVFSHEIGERKPERVVYEEVLKLTDSDFSECVFIDDREKNLAGAEEVGIKSILFEGVEDLEESLKPIVSGFKAGDA